MASKILFFTAGAKAASAEATAISRLQAKGYDVKVRNASSSVLYGLHGRESCDGVAGSIPDSYKALKAELDSLTRNHNGVFEATTAGAAGNDITVAFLGDSAGGAGVSIVRVNKAFVIHYESGVSTVGTVNTAVGNLGGGDDLFGVKTAGTAAHVLTAPYDNRTARNLAYGADAVADVTLPPVAKPETLKVLPATATAAHPATQQLQVLKAEQDESTGAIAISDVTATATYVSGTPANATVDGNGLITTVKAGETTVTATLASVAAAKAVLDCGAVPTKQLDTVLEAHTAGTAGNAITVALAMDSAGAVSINRTDSAFIIHAKPGTATVTDIETAITALGGGDDLFGVKTGGTGARVLDANAAFPVQSLTGGAAAVTSTSTCVFTVT